MSKDNSRSVTEDQLRGLFVDLVADLATQIRAGTATGKDKELALKLIDSFQIGISAKEAEPLELLQHDLPFAEMSLNRH